MFERASAPTERGLTRTIGYLAVACAVIAGAALAGFVVARDDVLVLPSDSSDGPVANRDGKTDRLPVAFAALASTSRGASSSAPPSPTDLLRQAYASVNPSADPEFDLTGPAVEPIVAPPLPSPRPKAADLPPLQKSYTLLSDIQIAAIKERLRLTEAQAKFWPPVEEALRAVAQKMHAARPSSSGKTAVPLDSTEAQQLQSAAAPLLKRLREDQKSEVRALARIIGLDVIASRI